MSPRECYTWIQYSFHEISQYSRRITEVSEPAVSGARSQWPAVTHVSRRKWKGHSTDNWSVSSVGLMMKSILVKGGQDVLENTALHLFGACRWYRWREVGSACGFPSMAFVQVVNHFLSRLWRSTGNSLAWRVHESGSRHTDLTFSTHLKQTALWNGTLHERDPYKVGIDKIFAKKHSNYFITLNSKNRSKALQNVSRHIPIPHECPSRKAKQNSLFARYDVFLGKIKINTSPFCCSLTKLNSTQLSSV